MPVLGDLYLISRSALEWGPSDLRGVYGTDHRWCFLICLAGETAGSLEQSCGCVGHCAAVSVRLQRPNACAAPRAARCSESQSLKSPWRTSRRRNPHFQQREMLCASHGKGWGGQSRSAHTAHYRQKEWQCQCIKWSHWIFFLAKFKSTLKQSFPLS